MALTLQLKCVENLKGKADRVARATFRGLGYDSKVVLNAKNSAYFGESFEWPIGRAVDSDETLDIQIYNYNKYLNNRAVGSFTLILQQVIQDGYLTLCESLVDSNNRILDTTISFEVRYNPPEGMLGYWDKDEFDYPLYDALPGENGPLGYDDNASITTGHQSLGARSTGSEGLPGEDTASQQAVLEDMFGSKKRPREEMEREMYKPRDYQVCVTIIEAQQLSGANIDPVVRVQVGDEHKYTNIKQSTNCPYFSEYFVFDFHEPPAMVFDKMITLTVYHAHNIPGRGVMKAGNIVAGSTIGSFKCDVGTVYCTPEHQFYHKWAVLVDPNELGEGPKGFLKCDLAVIGKGDILKTPKTNSEDDNIEGNLLLPSGVPMERQRANYIISVYRAEDLPRMDSGLIANVKKALIMSDNAFVDAFVRVSFVGHMGKTGVKKSYFPEWKEQLTFVDMFPPLCNRIKIEVVDSDAVTDDVIATHYIELMNIMDAGSSGSDGFLPTFGPSWINFYGGPRHYKVIDSHSDLNEGYGEGVAFRGRLLFAVKTQLIQGEFSGPSTVIREKIKTATKIQTAPRREFLLFGTIFEASMIDREWREKNIYFEMSMGTAGNVLDGRPTKSIFTSESEGEEDEADNSGEKTQLLKQSSKHLEEPPPCRSTTDAQKPVTSDGIYWHMPYAEERPCVYVVLKTEDLRKRIYHSNAVEKIIEKLEMGLDEVKGTMNLDHAHPERKMRRVMSEYVTQCENYLKAASSLTIGAGSGKTKLDKGRINVCKNHIDKLKTQAAKIKTDVTSVNVRERLKEAKLILRKTKYLLKDPQDALPDVFIWMICDKKRIAYHRIPARHLMHANTDDHAGKQCGKTQTIFLKRPGKLGSGRGGWAIQAKLQMHLWLGLRDNKRKVKEFMNGLPEGYEQTAAVRKADQIPPEILVYKEKHTFQFRAHMYQARRLIGSDDTGLSDPFARVSIMNQCKSTQVIKQTNSPTWDETLIFDDVTLHGKSEDIVKNPPMIIIEFFDYDKVGKPEFLGRAITKPKVKLDDVPYVLPSWPPQLQWWDVFRGSNQAGQVLAAFELLQADNPEELPELPEGKGKGATFSLPPTIKPTLSKFRVEVLFWGMRQVRRVQLLSVDRPRIDLECGGDVMSSKRIENMQKNSNFDEPLQFRDVLLPDNELFWPPITIKCVDCRNFGRDVLVGTHTISHTQRFRWLSPEEKEERQNRLRLGAGISHWSLTSGSIQGSIAGSPGERGTLRAISVNGEDTPSVAHIPKGDRLSTLRGFVTPDRGSLSHMSIHDDKASLAKGSIAETASTGAKSSSSGEKGSIGVPPAGDRASLAPSATSGDRQSRANSPNAMTADRASLAPSARAGDGAILAPGSITRDRDSPLPSARDGDRVSLVSKSGGADRASLLRGTRADAQDVIIQIDGPHGPVADGAVVAIHPDGSTSLARQPKPATALDKVVMTAAPGQPGLAPPSQPQTTGTAAARKKRKEAIADFDWWSKYYVTKEDIAEKEKEEEEERKKRAKACEDYDSDAESFTYCGHGTVMNYGDFSKMQLDEDEIEEIEPKKKKKRKIKISKKKLKEKASKLKGAVNDAFVKSDDEEEEEDDNEADMDAALDKSIITRLEVYDCELEKKFGGFEEYLQTFNLYKGKSGDDEDEDDEERISGKFKGTMLIYKVGELGAPSTLKLGQNLHSNKPLPVLVRIYIIKAVDLHPVDLNGKADPYIVLKLGNKEISDKENRKNNELNPVFGKCYEMNVTFPMDSILKISVMDYDLLSSDDLIGETTIDLENRFFSKHRATCGISDKYEIYGYNSWRDPMKPTQIVAKLCKDNNLEPPEYKHNHVRFAGLYFTASGEVENEHGELNPSSENLALEILKNWHNVPEVGCKLTPEHVETRHLYNPEKRGVEQGRLEMWIDIFPKDMPSPTIPVDITPRQPKGYELRCIIWNTDEVKLDDNNVLTGEASSDIFVRGYLLGRGEDDQQTDVHYRSLTGEGNFNWRFLFPFNYLKAEEKLVLCKKESVFALDESEIKVPAKLSLQVWDADLVSADDFLGAVTLDLNRMPRPAKSAKHCNEKMLAIDNKWPIINLFRNKQCRGWWPMMATDEETGLHTLVGKVEAELRLLTGEEAEKSPAGAGREDPDALPQPNRPDSSFLWFMNPLKTLRYIIWKNYKWLILKLLLLLLFVALLVLFFYSMPGYTVKKMFGA